MAFSFCRQLALLALLSMCHAAPALGFKIETHVWIADQLAAEINGSGGHVTIDGRQYALDSRVARAIDKDPGAFVMGTLGADIYPDMFAGQMTTHPGVNPAGAAPGWQTDDWLRHVVSAAVRGGDDSSIAFAAGYLLHAAMDLWAHSYVNLYSGDVFEILNNSETAQRHVALESYLTRFHVNLRDRYPHSVNYDRYSAMRAPAEFVRRTLILDRRAAREYGRDASTATFYYTAMYRYYLSARRARGAAGALAAVLESELERVDPLLDQLPALKAQLDAKQFSFDQQLVRLAAAAQDVLDGFNGMLDSSGVQEMLEGAGIPVQLDAPATLAAAALDSAVAQYRAVTDEIGYAVSGFYEPASIRALLQQGIGLAAAGAPLQRWPADIESAVDAWVRAWEETARELMRPKNLPGRDPLRPMQRWAQCWAPVLFPQPAAAGPQRLAAGCDRTMTRLADVQTEVASVAGALVNLMPGYRQLQRLVADLEYQVMEAAQQHATAGLDAFGAALPNAQIAAVSEDLPSDPTGLATWLVRMWDSHTSAADLDQAWADSSALTPYVARRVSPAVHRELQLCDRGEARATRYSDAPMAGFAPVQNAVTLSRLALLDAAGLNAVIADRLKRIASPGPALRRVSTQPYRSRLPMGVVLDGAVRSIDGDHPWQATAPPLPRRDGSATDADRRCRRYGYPAGDAYAGGRCDGDRMMPRDLARKPGMVLWRQPYRELLFDALFEPIATSLCDFVGFDYPHASCNGSDPRFPEYRVADRAAPAASLQRLPATTRRRAGSAILSPTAPSTPERAAPRAPAPTGTAPAPPRQRRRSLCDW